MKKNLDMTEGKPISLLWAFTFPTLMGNLLNQVYSITDSIVVGRYLGQTALAAVGSTMPVILLLAALMIGINVGVGIIISRYFGQKNEDLMRRAFVNSLYLGLFLLGMPLVLKVLGKLFTREQLTSPQPAFWTWLGPIPLLLCYYHANQGYFILDPEILFHPFFQLYILITLGMLVGVALLLVRSFQGGLRQAQTMLQVKEQNLRLQGQLNALNDYAAALRKEQQELAILRHDSRHQLRLLGNWRRTVSLGKRKSIC